MPVVESLSSILRFNLCKENNYKDNVCLSGSLAESLSSRV